MFSLLFIVGLSAEFSAASMAISRTFSYVDGSSSPVTGGATGGMILIVFKSGNNRFL
jgi:hypothetical protein